MTVTTPTLRPGSSPDLDRAGTAQCTLEIGWHDLRLLGRPGAEGPVPHRRMVTAALNLATETATLRPAAARGGSAPAAPVAGGRTGAGAGAEDLEGARDTEIRRLERKWQIALTAGLGLMAVMYVPIHIDTMNWLIPLILVVATVVQLWAGADIWRSAWATRPVSRTCAAPARRGT